MLHVPYNAKQIKQAYISKHNEERDCQANLLMITDGTANWHYLAIKNISGLLREITSNHIHKKVKLKNIKGYVKIMIFVVY